MTGGREGSNILQNNEVLQYPAVYSNTGTTPGYTLKKWLWSNEKAKATEVSRAEIDVISCQMLLGLEVWSEEDNVQSPHSSSWSLRGHHAQQMGRLPWWRYHHHHQALIL